MEDVGRPTVMTEQLLGKLEEGFAYGMTDKEACFYADIDPDTLYEYQKKFPKFTERKKALKDKPVMKARQTIVDALDDPTHSKWYLERKKSDEFGSKQEIEHNVKPIKHIILTRGDRSRPVSGTDNTVALGDTG